MTVLMVVLQVILVIFLILALISCIPLGVYGEYGEKGFRFCATVWKKKFELYPKVSLETTDPKKALQQEAKKKKSEEKKKKTQEKKEEKKQSAQNASGKKSKLSKKSKKSQKSKSGKKEEKVADDLTLQEKIELARRFLPLIFSSLEKIGRYKKIDRLELDLVVGSEDPVKAVVLYGQAHALLGTLWMPLDQTLNIQKGRAGVRMEFEETIPRFSGIFALSLTLGQLVVLLLHMGLGSYKILEVKPENKVKT